MWNLWDYATKTESQIIGIATLSEQNSLFTTELLRSKNNLRMHGLLRSKGEQNQMLLKKQNKIKSS